MIFRDILLIIFIGFFALLPGWNFPDQGDGQFELRLTRNFGYSSGSGRIQGAFTLKATGLEELKQVTFYIDGEVLGEVRGSPFHLRFNTADHSLGSHTLYAVGLTTNGEMLQSNEIRVEFVSAQDGWQAGMRILIPIILTIFGAIAISVAVTFISGSKTRHIPPGTPRKYGVSGGAICLNCLRPFPRRFWIPNLISGKLERCPFCGKWGVLTARPLEELRAAEEAELESWQKTGLLSELSEEERFRRDLDETRFQDL
jgi:hypothetical protein